MTSEMVGRAIRSAFTDPEHFVVNWVQHIVDDHLQDEPVDVTKLMS